MCQKNILYRDDELLPSHTDEYNVEVTGTRVILRTSMEPTEIPYDSIGYTTGVLQR
jgi:hypothetical protein